MSVPRVKDTQTSGLDLKSAASNVDERPTGGTEQQVIEDAWCMQCDDVECFGHGEDHVEVGYGEKLAASCFEPSE